jgi:hypothetical protein
MLRTRRLSPSWGNCCYSCKIAVLNSSIFWHFELCWLIIWPIKSHICTIGFMYGDIACHGIVWTAACLKNVDQYGLYAPNVVVHEHWPVNQRMIVEMERTHCHCIFGLPDYQQELTSSTYSQRENNPRPQKAVVPTMWLTWNEVFCWRQTLARPSVGRNKKPLSSDQWTRFHVRIVHPKWSCDQSNQAWRWCSVNCGRFMGRRARIPWWWKRLITVRVIMWHPNAKLPRRAPAVLNGRCRTRLDMSRSSLGVVL